MELAADQDVTAIRILFFFSRNNEEIYQVKVELTASRLKVVENGSLNQAQRLDPCVDMKSDAEASDVT